MFSESLFSTVLICSFQEIFSSNITPKNLIEACHFKSYQQILSLIILGIIKGRSSLVLLL